MDMEYEVAVGLAVHSERIAARLTQKQLAEIARVPERTLSRIENGDPHLGLLQLRALAHAMGSTPADLLMRAEQILGRSIHPMASQANSGGQNLIITGSVKGNITVADEGD